MLWALAITVCLAHEGDVTCREWRAEPFKTKYECQREGRRIMASLEGTDPHYAYLQCERGEYS